MNWKLLIFDCDGVLVDSEGIANRVFAEQVVGLGISMTTEEAAKRFTGIKMSKSIDYVEELLGHPVPVEFLTDYRRRSFEAFRQELQPIKGIEELIKKLDKPFCVASNGPRNKVELNLSITNLLPYFEENIFTAYEIGKWKPDPEFYLSVANQMGCSPEECIVVEDSKFGVKAGHVAGMKVMGYTAGNDGIKKELLAEGAIPFDSMNLLHELLF